MATGSRIGRMARCKHTGKPLPPNLYSDPKGRPSVYRYRSEAGTYKTLRLPYSRAVAIAKQANSKRTAPEGSLVYWVEQYRRWQIEQRPEIAQKRGWKDRQRQLEQFAKQWNRVPVRALNVATLAPWWEGLTYDQQHGRRSHFSGFFQWAMARGAAKTNPFSHRDDVARLMERAKPAKQRGALSLEQYRLIYAEAEPHIQIAMQISLATTMRAGDIVALRWEQIVDGRLQTTIRKSLNQRGASAAAHLEWTLDEHPLLRDAIQTARARRMKSGDRCEYIISRPRQRKHVIGKGLTHPRQCRVEHLSRGFAKARDAAGIEGPSFHEIRGLAITLLLDNGMDITAVSKLAAHISQSTTSAYTAGQAPRYINMAGMQVPA